MFELSERNQKNEIELNDYLKNATEKINKFQQIAKNSIFAISLILANIAEYPNAYFENSKYLSISEYGEEMFGYKKSYTYKLIKISKFIKIKNIDGDIIPVKDLIDDNNNNLSPKDGFIVKQQALLPDYFV